MKKIHICPWKKTIQHVVKEWGSYTLNFTELQKDTDFARAVASASTELREKFHLCECADEARSVKGFVACLAHLDVKYPFIQNDQVLMLEETFQKWMRKAYEAGMRKGKRQD